MKTESGSVTEEKKANSGNILKQEIVRFGEISVWDAWDEKPKDNLYDNYVLVFQTRNQLLTEPDQVHG